MLHLQNSSSEGVGFFSTTTRGTISLFVDAAFAELRSAIFEAYAAIAEEGAEPGTEQQRREARWSFDEILEWRPLSTFSATHLKAARGREGGC
jgi:hypothetical protein